MKDATPPHADMSMQNLISAGMWSAIFLLTIFVLAFWTDGVRWYELIMLLAVIIFQGVWHTIVAVRKVGQHDRMVLDGFVSRVEGKGR